MMYYGKTNECLRKLARGNKWQIIYAQSRELGSVKLFYNDNNFGDLQLQFLNYLAFYYSLLLDIAMGEVEEIVITDFIYEDSYIYYKNREDKQKMNELPKHQINDKHNKNKMTEKIVQNQSRIVFKKPKE